MDLPTLQTLSPSATLASYSSSKRKLDLKSPPKSPKKMMLQIRRASHVSINLEQMKCLEVLEEVQRSESVMLSFANAMEQCRCVCFAEPYVENTDPCELHVKRHYATLPAIIACALNISVQKNTESKKQQSDDQALVLPTLNFVTALQHISADCLDDLQRFHVGSSVHAAWNGSLAFSSLAHMNNRPYVMLSSNGKEKVLSLAACAARFVHDLLVKPSPEANAEDNKEEDYIDVFLGGACNPTTWRRDTVIPMLQKATPTVTFYNPQVEDWTPDLVAVEAKAKATCKVMLFVLNGQTTGMATAVEIAELMSKGRRVFLVCEEIKEDGPLKVTQEARHDINRARTYLRDTAKRAGPKVTLYQTIEEAVAGVIKFFGATSEEHANTTQNA